MKLPTSQEINPHPGCLDGQYAVKMFLGKDLHEAEAMFAENGISRQEDLFYMGPRAFAFYFPAALNYLKSNKSENDSDFASSMTGMLEWRLLGEYNDFDDLKPVTAEMLEFVSFIIEHYEKYDVTQEIYGDLRPRLKTLAKKLTADSNH